jgi:hypothetical protein
MGKWASGMGKLNSTSCPWRSDRQRAAVIGPIEKSLSQMGDFACSRNLRLETAAEAGGQDPCSGIWSQRPGPVTQRLAVHWPVRGQLETRHGFRSLLPSMLSLARQAFQVSVSFFPMIPHSSVLVPLQTI